MQLSFSALKWFERCKGAFKLMYIDKVQRVEKVSEAAHEGKLFHEVMEKTQKLAATGLDVAKAFEEAQKALEEKLTDRVVKLLRKIDPKLIYSKATITKGAAELRIAITRDLAPTNFEAEDAAFRGILDLVWFSNEKDMTILNVLDFKTGAHIEPDPLQLEFYAFLAKNYYKHFEQFNLIRVSFYHVSPDGAVRSTFEYAPEQTPDEKFIKLYESIENEREFPHTPGPWCSWCPVAHHCPHAQPTDTADIKELAKKYLAMKRALENIETQLREYIKDHGPIDAESATLKIQSYLTKKPKAEAFRKVLKSAPKEVLIKHIQPSQKLLAELNVELSPEDYETRVVEKIIATPKSRG